MNIRRLASLFAILALLAAACADKDEDFQAHFDRGEAAMEQAAQDPAQLQAAVDSFTRALEIRPGSAQAHYLRGMAHMKLRDLVNARSDFDAAVQSDPAMGEAYYQRALCLIGLQSPDQDAIRRDLEKALELNPDLAPAKNLLTVLKPR